MPTLDDLTGDEAQNVLRHLDPWGRTQAALAIKPWSRLGTLPARKLVLSAVRFHAPPQRLAQLAAAAPQAEELQLFLDPTTSEGTLHAMLRCLGGRTCLTSLVIAEVSPFWNAPPTAMLGPSLSFVAPYLTSLTLYIQGTMSYSRAWSMEGLHHLLACQHLQHLKLAPASCAANRSFRGLNAAGLLVVAQLPPLTAAELVLDVCPYHWEEATPEQQLQAPGVAQEVVQEALRIKQQLHGPLIMVAAHVFAHHHGPSLRCLCLAAGSASRSLERPVTWACPWDMPHLESYTGDQYIQLEFRVAGTPHQPACSSTLTSLQLKQRVGKEVWEVLPQWLPKLQLLGVDVCGLWEPSCRDDVTALQWRLKGHPPGMSSLGSMDCLTTLRWHCFPGTALSACSHLTQLRDLEVTVLWSSIPYGLRVRYVADLEGLHALEQLTRLHIAGPCAWEVEDSSWTALAGSLPHLKHLSVAALMTGQVSVLPGTGLVALHLDAGSAWPPLQLAGEALPASLTQLHLKMVQVTDTPGGSPGTAAAVQQAWERGLPWIGPPLQLLHLEELLLGGVSSWMPATAFSGSPVTRLQLQAALPACAEASHDVGAPPLDLGSYCQALPLLRKLQVDMTTGHAEEGKGPASLPQLTPLTGLGLLASLRLVAASFAEAFAPSNGAPLGPILQQLLQLTRLELLETGGSTARRQVPLLERPGVRQALRGCKSLRVLQLHPCGMYWTGVPYDNELESKKQSKEVNAQAYRERMHLMGNCVVLPFEEPRCGQL